MASSVDVIKLTRESLTIRSKLLRVESDVKVYAATSTLLRNLYKIVAQLESVFLPNIYNLYFNTESPLFILRKHCNMTDKQIEESIYKKVFPSFSDFLYNVVHMIGPSGNPKYVGELIARYYYENRNDESKKNAFDEFVENSVNSRHLHEYINAETIRYNYL